MDKKHMNDGVIRSVIVDYTKHINLPLEMYGYYHNNKEFIGQLAYIWNKFSKEHGFNEVITPTYLTKYLDTYDIRTNHGHRYQGHTRGPFNLIRAAYNYYDALEKNEKKKARTCDPSEKACFTASAKHFGIFKSLIAQVYVNQNSNYAWE